MSAFPFNERAIDRLRSAGAPQVLIERERALQRVLNFTRRSIDDVVNCPIAKREVLGYYKLHLQVQRSTEITELERQWNANRLY